MAKTHDFRNARDKVNMLLQRALGNTGLNPFLGHSCRVKKSPSSRRIGPLGSFVPAVFGRDVCLCPDPCYTSADSIMLDKNGAN